MDFENLNVDEKLEEDRAGISHENILTKENKALHQEATAVLSSTETEDLYMSENVDEELSDDADFQGVGVMSTDKTQEEDYTSSDGDSAQEGSIPGEDEEDEEEDMGAGEEPGELLMSVRCGNEFCNGNKEDRIFAEGQPLAPEGAENPQVRNEEQGDSESDEELSYFERVPEHGSGMRIKGDGIEEDEQERKEEKQEDSENEAMKTEQEENVLARCFEPEARNPRRDGPAKASLEFPDIDLSVQNLQDLVADVDSEEYVEKMKDFSGGEHQEAGESFADYPSDCSSCEYVEDGGKNQESNHQSAAKQDTCSERAETDLRWMGRAKDSDEEGVEYLFSIDLEVAADGFSSLDAMSGEKDKGKIELVERMSGDAAVMGCETGESDSYGSSDDEGQGNRSDKELFEKMFPQDLHSGSSATFARWSTCGDYNRADPADFNINWNPDAEDTDKGQTLLSDVTPAEGVSTYSVAQRGDARTTSPSNQGSLDDSFFFNAELEASEITELGQLGDDEYEEERNWEQEQERIKAFYEFYDDSDGQNGKEGE